MAIGNRIFPALLPLLVLGCATVPPTPPAPPSAMFDVSRAAGSPLGADAATSDISADDLIHIDVTWIALTRPVADELSPLDALSSLTSAPLGGGAVLVSGQETRAARFGGGLAATRLIERWARRVDGPAAQVGHQLAWAAPGTTVRFRCDADAPKRSVSLAIYRPASSAATTRPAATFAIGLSGTATTRPADASPAAGQETAFVEGVPLSADTPFALVVPWPAPAGPWTTLAAYIEIRPPAEPGDPDAQAAASEINRLLADRRTRPAGPTTLPGEQLALRRAIDALKSAPDPRPALTYLAATTSARIAGDVALVADPTLLGKLRDAVLALDSPAASPAVSPDDSTTSPDAIGWLLDRTTVLTLADAGSKAPLPPEMIAALAIHAGEVGRHPDTLADIANSVGSAADLNARLVGENYIALEDNAASARVRAFDWLKAQGRAPADYDPLGPVRDRRRAINRAINAAPGGTP